MERCFRYGLAHPERCLGFVFLVVVVVFNIVQQANLNSLVSFAKLQQLVQALLLMGTC